MQKFLNFEKMITPTIIKILFWIGIGLSSISALITIFSGFGQMFSRFGSPFIGFLTIIFGFIIFGVGVIFSRIYCELLIVAFKILNTLTSIDDKLDTNRLHEEG